MKAVTPKEARGVKAKRDAVRPLAAIAHPLATHLHYAEPAEVVRKYVGRRRSARTLCGQTLDAVRFVDPYARRVCNACAAEASASKPRAIVRERSQSASLEFAAINGRLTRAWSEREVKRDAKIREREARRPAKPVRARGVGRG